MGETSVGSFLWETSVFGLSLAEVLGKAVFVVVVTLVASIAERTLSRTARRALNKAKVPSASILINMLRGVVWMLALMMVLEPVFGIQPTAFLAALGVGSVALSLGMQDTVSNIIGGLSLMLSKVIEPGDVIKIGDFTGTVTDINWRSTCVSDAYGQVNVIPNSVLSKTALVKLSDFTATRCVLQLVAVQGSDFEEIRQDVERIAQETLGEWYEPELGVQLIVLSFDAAGIQMQIAVHLSRGVLIDEARTRLASGITGRPWVKVP